MGLGSHNHQVVNFFHLVGVLASVKQLGNVCIRHHYLGASETSSSRGYGGGGPVPGRPTGSCTVILGAQNVKILIKNSRSLKIHLRTLELCSREVDLVCRHCPKVFLIIIGIPKRNVGYIFIISLNRTLDLLLCKDSGFQTF